MAKGTTKENDFSRVGEFYPPVRFQPDNKGQSAGQVPIMTSYDELAPNLKIKIKTHDLIFSKPSGIVSGIWQHLPGRNQWSGSGREKECRGVGAYK